MTTHTLRRARPVALLTALALAWPGGAHASTPEVTDPVGDATPIVSSCDMVAPPTDPCTPTPGSQDPVDIIEADLSTDGSDLLFTTTVVDIDAGPPNTTPAFAMVTAGNGVEIRVFADTPGGVDGRVLVEGPDGWGNAPVSMAISTAGNTATWRIPLTTLNAATAPACSSCSPFANGVVLDELRASTWLTWDGTPFSTFSDGASGQTSYTIGTA